jgi:hypothetical protein
MGIMVAAQDNIQLRQGIMVVQCVTVLVTTKNQWRFLNLEPPSITIVDRTHIAPFQYGVFI